MAFSTFTSYMILIDKKFSWLLWVGISFFLSCTDVARDNPYDSGGTNYMGDQLSSSSSDEPSSSSSLVASSSSVAASYSSSSTQVNTPSSQSTAQSSSSSIAGSSSSSSTQGGQSSSSKAATVTGACVENNPISGFTCSWDGYSAGRILTPGAMLKPAASTLPSGCSSVAYKYAPDNTSMALNYDCSAMPASGIAAEGSRNYVLFAELTCDDGKHTTACNPKDGWSSKRAPYLDGTCKWEKNPTTTARGGYPSGVTVVDTDNVCGTTKSVVYKYADGTKTWPATGILDEWKSWDIKHKETYDVKAYLNCPAYNQTITSQCPPLEVYAGADHVIECDCSGNNCNLSYDICKADGVNRSYEVTLKNDECVEMNVLNYTQAAYLPSLVMRCDVQGTQNDVSLTLELNGQAQKFTGSWVWNGEIKLGALKLGDNEFGTLCVTNLVGATSVRCRGPSQ